jgi:hypothetical protein
MAKRKKRIWVYVIGIIASLFDVIALRKGHFEQAS